MAPKRLSPSSRRSRRRALPLALRALAALALALITGPLHHAAVHALIPVPDPVVHFSVGAVAGAAGAVASYPFDYIKSQMQTPAGASTYDNGWDALVTTVKRNPLELYRGLGVQVLGIAPEKGIKLGVNDALKTVASSALGGFPLWAMVCAGAAAGACQVVATSPLEVLKVGLQTSDGTFGQVWREAGGVRGLYRGAGACLFRDVLWTAVCFPLYAIWAGSSMNPFVAGALSGAVASGVTTPPDVIKTRILSQDGSTRRTRNAASDDDDEDDDAGSSNPIRVARRIAREEGVGALFRGVHERCIGAIPRFGTTLAMHDVLEKCASNLGWLSHIS